MAVEIPCQHTAIPHDERQWTWFILVSLVIYAGGLVLITIGRMVTYFLNYHKTKNSICSEFEEEAEHDELEQGCYLDFKEGAGELLSAQSVQGRVMVVASFVLNMASCALYITESSYPVEHCFLFADQFWKVEVCLNIFFVFHFIVRFFAANDKLYFWGMDPYSLIDILTIPTIFVAIVLKQNWLGVRFLRIVYMMSFSDILQFLNVTTSGTTVEIVNIIGTFLSVWLSSAGFVHLLENTGDFWPPINYQNSRTINYFECTYFLLVTMSTVGYGDIYCETYLGRIFCMLFIGVGLGLFASYLPAIQEYFASHTKYNRDYKPTPGKRHVIVAGHITTKSISSFVKDFLHPDREDNKTNIVFLSPTFPTIATQAVLKRHGPRTLYFVGTIYSTYDCHRMKMRQADAVIILCNKKCVNPDEEDAANITRVISVKNYHENMRCIVQLIMNRNKSHLLNCPQWKRELGDDIVCINELKHGFIAQSCNAPGFSTLLANLFAMRGDKINEEIHETEQWKVAYMSGAGNELYTATLSESFVGMTFPQAVEICFEKLNLMLIAVEVKVSRTEKYFAINPSEKGEKIVRILKYTRGFFFAQNANDVARATRFCHICHKNIIDPTKMGKCRCRRNRKIDGKGIFGKKKKVAETKLELDPSRLLEGLDDSAEKSKKNLTNDYYPNGAKPKFDQSGTFYWCEAKPFEEAKLTLEQASNQFFTNHVVVLALSTTDSPMLELRQFVLPLRASNNNPYSLKKVVILGNGEFLKREWKSLANFPDIDIVPGSPYNRTDLRAVNVATSDMCVLLSPGHSDNIVEHQALSDKEVILVTLNLKAMKFQSKNLIKLNPMYLLNGKELSYDNNKLLKNEVEQSKPFETEVDDPLDSRPASREEDNPVPQQVMNEREWSTVNIPIITELAYDTNAMYLDQDDMNIYDDDGIFLTQPYACGAAFTVSVLDSLVSATYFNSDILTLVRNIVTGSVSLDLDELLQEGKQPTGSFETPEIAAVRNRCRVAQLSLSDGLLSDFGECGLFGDLFLYALRTYNMICLGLYRFRDSQKATLGKPSTKRYVITFPPFNFVLSPNDLVFVLMQFNCKQKKRKGLMRNNSGLTSRSSINLKTQAR